MTETSLDELGPVDYLVVEFPAGAANFTGEMAKELVTLVDAGTIRIIDVLILAKNEDGTVDASELSDVAELGELEAKSRDRPTVPPARNGPEAEPSRGRRASGSSTARCGGCVGVRRPRRRTRGGRPARLARPGEFDLDVEPGGREDLRRAGSWPEGNRALARALAEAGYTVHARMGRAGHNSAQAGLDLPEPLAWLWSDLADARAARLA